MKKLFIILSISFLMNACTEEKPHEHTIIKTPSIVLESTIDPICKMNVQINRTDTILYQGKIYGFCSHVCKEKFLNNFTNLQEEKMTK